MTAKQDRDVSSPSDKSETHHYHVVMGGGRFVVVRRPNVWRPPTDVMETDDRLIVLVEIAGMKTSDFNVAISPHQLIISGTRPAHLPGCTAYHQLEIGYGEFRTDVLLPWPVDEENIVARYEDGFLRVELPRLKPKTVRVIPVDRREA